VKKESTQLQFAESRTLNRYSYEPSNFEQAMRLAELLCKSGLVPQVGLKANRRAMKPQELIAILMQGRELGQPTMWSIRNLFSLYSQVGMKADGMVALCLVSPHCEYFIPIEQNAQRSVWETKRIGAPKAIRNGFTVEDAKRAGLHGDGWEKWGPRLLSARAKSFLARDIYPDVVGGIMSFEELSDPAVVVAHAGPTQPAIDVEPEPAPKPDPEPEAKKLPPEKSKPAPKPRTTTSGGSNENTIAGEEACKQISAALEAKGMPAEGKHAWLEIRKKMAELGQKDPRTYTPDALRKAAALVVAKLQEKPGEGESSEAATEESEAFEPEGNDPPAEEQAHRAAGGPRHSLKDVGREIACLETLSPHMVAALQENGITTRVALWLHVLDGGNVPRLRKERYEELRKELEARIAAQLDEEEGDEAVSVLAASVLEVKPEEAALMLAGSMKQRFGDKWKLATNSTFVGQIRALYLHHKEEG
jgi:hypothetical protein